MLLYEYSNCSYLYNHVVFICMIILYCILILLLSEFSNFSCCSYLYKLVVHVIKSCWSYLFIFYVVLICKIMLFLSLHILYYVVIKGLSVLSVNSCCFIYTHSMLFLFVYSCFLLKYIHVGCVQYCKDKIFNKLLCVKEKVSFICIQYIK